MTAGASDGRLTCASGFKSQRALSARNEHRIDRRDANEVTPKGRTPIHPLLSPAGPSSYRVNGPRPAAGVCGSIPQTTMHDTTEPEEVYRAGS